MEGFTIESFLGSFFILIFFVFILYGIFCAQVYHYFATYRDPLALKMVVLLLCVLESLHAAACMHMLYSYLVLFVTEPAKELTIIWSVAAIIFLEHMIGITVQLYYIYRLWKVSQSLVILLVLLVVEAARIGIGFRSVAYTCTSDTWAGLVSAKGFSLYANLTYSFNIVVDAAIAALLVYHFNTKSRAFAHARSTKHILLMLTYSAITAGALTVIASVIVCIVYNTAKTSAAYSGVLQIVAKLYAISMLTMLNARNSIRNAVSQNGMSLQLTALSNSRTSRSQTTVQVFRETKITSDAWEENGHSTGEPTDSSILDTTVKAGVV